MLGLVHDLQGVDVLDPAFFVLAVEHAVFEYIQLHQRTIGDGPGEHAEHRQQGDGVTDQAWPHQVGLLARQVVLGGVTDQPFRVVHFLHDAVAGIDARGAADAFDLQAVTDVDASGADVYAHFAVDAVTQALGFVVRITLAWATVFAAAWVIGDDQGVLVEHHALEARVGAHVDAHLLAQVAGVAVGRKGKETHPEQCPATGLQSEQFGDQLANWREVAYEGDGCDQ